ncbi:hypothetical protein [Spongiactinospora sp. TRM90649]|uniref:hypothetical protein n=1 Tax=Spongiactinospora sp. TRM90649 TaxID=3031114 RepID=UPI0023FA3FF5|nr:hypothetical protein [Spongiactinospora sp. TRM90649]MDF5753920.1 hypothetical protein [Spongiactinospora sp. TRM90649]
MGVEDLAVTRPDLTTVTVTHHLEEVPSTTTHALLMREGRVLASGEGERVLAGSALSECFGRPLALDRVDGRWYLRAPRV